MEIEAEMGLKHIVLVLYVVFSASVGLAGIIDPVTENIDPYEEGSQYAYGENVGWLNFEPNEGPGVNVADSNVLGYVWGENIGWISLKAATPVAYKVQTSWITSCSIRFDDLAMLVQQWLYGPSIIPDGDGMLVGDLDSSGDVDFGDYARLADLWLGLCPPGWPLAQ